MSVSRLGGLAVTAGLLALTCLVTADTLDSLPRAGHPVSILDINQAATGRSVMDTYMIDSMQALADSQNGSTVHRYEPQVVAQRALETTPEFTGRLSVQLVIAESERQTRSQHASTIAEVGPGQFVAAWFGGTWERMGDVGIWSARYADGVWGPARQVVAPQPDAKHPSVNAPAWNPVLMHVEHLNTTFLFYKTGVDTKVWRGFLRRSTDGGLTWGEPQALPEPLVGPAKNPPLVLPDGEIISPSSDENDDWTSHVEVSTDDGATWHRQPDIAFKRGIIQPAIFRTLSGRLRMLMRTHKEHELATTESHNHGLTWHSPTLSGVESPNAGICAISLADGRVAVVHNTGSGRNTLALSLSYDEGDSYELSLILEYEEQAYKRPLECVKPSAPKDTGKAEYSYPTIIQSKYDGNLHITYTYSYYGAGSRCFGRENVKHLIVDPCKIGNISKAPRPCVHPSPTPVAVMAPVPAVQAPDDSPAPESSSESAAHIGHNEEMQGSNASPANEGSDTVGGAVGPDSLASEPERDTPPEALNSGVRAGQVPAPGSDQPARRPAQEEDDRAPTFAPESRPAPAAETTDTGMSTPAESSPSESASDESHPHPHAARETAHDGRYQEFITDTLPGKPSAAGIDYTAHLRDAFRNPKPGSQSFSASFRVSAAEEGGKVDGSMAEPVAGTRTVAVNEMESSAGASSTGLLISTAAFLLVLLGAALI